MDISCQSEIEGRNPDWALRIWDDVHSFLPVTFSIIIHKKAMNNEQCKNLINNQCSSNHLVIYLDISISLFDETVSLDYQKYICLQSRSPFHRTNCKTVTRWWDVCWRQILFLLNHTSRSDGKHDDLTPRGSTFIRLLRTIRQCLLNHRNRLLL